MADTATSFVASVAADARHSLGDVLAAIRARVESGQPYLVLTVLGLSTVGKTMLHNALGALAETVTGDEASQDATRLTRYRSYVWKHPEGPDHGTLQIFCLDLPGEFLRNNENFINFQLKKASKDDFAPGANGQEFDLFMAAMILADAYLYAVPALAMSVLDDNWEVDEGNPFEMRWADMGEWRRHIDPSANEATGQLYTSAAGAGAIRRSHFFSSRIIKLARDFSEAYWKRSKRTQLEIVQANYTPGESGNLFKQIRISEAATPDVQGRPFAMALTMYDRIILGHLAAKDPAAIQSPEGLAAAVSEALNLPAFLEARIKAMPTGSIERGNTAALLAAIDSAAKTFRAHAAFPLATMFPALKPGAGPAVSDASSVEWVSADAPGVMAQRASIYTSMIDWIWASVKVARQRAEWTVEASDAAGTLDIRSEGELWKAPESARPQQKGMFGRLQAHIRGDTLWDDAQ